MIKLSISIMILLSMAVAILFHFTATGFDEKLCKNTIYREYLSPNNLRKAVVFQRDCAATTGYSTQVSIIDANKSLKNSAGNILVLKGEAKVVAPKIEWKNNQKVVIYHSMDGNEFKAKTELKPDSQIRILYQ